ncbi:alpha/beta hydrolase [Janibacter alkaliphilus]|uniref:Pimeloyl-ACP methyl ester carboxylesterase n=1 Tax=Janibacter alkaliphilus TaxID=1069963 RepID=A0A852XCJ5_9MICO|nr:pimeloyl-ACP methyl ester carboxylesterase [Janibacter alkaliphilus]
MNRPAQVMAQGTAVRLLSAALPDGSEVAVREHPGEPGGPTLVLAHGWCLAQESWDPVVTELRRRRPGLRVLTYDQPGHGASSPIHGDRIEVRDLGRALGAVLAEHAPEGELVLGGHSMGGMTVMALAGLQPDLVRERVRGLLLAATMARPDPRRRGIPGERLVMGLMARFPDSWPGLPTTPAMTARNLFGADPDPEAVEATSALTAATGGRTTGLCYGAIMRHDEVDALGGLSGVPTFVVTGSRDRLTPVRRGRHVAAHAPGSTFWSVPGAGHMLAWEATDLLVDRLERLLDATPAAARP